MLSTVQHTVANPNSIHCLELELELERFIFIVNGFKFTLLKNYRKISSGKVLDIKLLIHLFRNARPNYNHYKLTINMSVTYQEYIQYYPVDYTYNKTMIVKLGKSQPWNLKIFVKFFF